MRTGKVAALCLSIVQADSAIAQDEPLARSDIRIELPANAEGLIVLEVRQASLSRVFDAISDKTGVRVHRSVVPEEPATATCAGATLERIMQCLLGPGADLAYRYANGKSGGEASERPTDIWVLGSSFAKTCAAPADRAQARDRRPAGGAKTHRLGEFIFSQDDPAQLATQAISETPARRANAIARLTVAANADPAIVRTIFERGLTDEDPQVRAQAVNGLVKRGIGDVAATLATAMADGDASVRLMAVDNMGGDARQVELLRAALADPDATVSALATLKLKALEP